MGERFDLGERHVESTGEGVQLSDRAARGLALKLNVDR